MKNANDFSDRRRLTRTLALAAMLALGTAGSVLADAYDPPSDYYAGATGIGSTLKSQLTTITSSNFHARTYGDARNWMPIVDRDPANAAHILLDYNRASVTGTWDSGVTYNREHVWPKSLLSLTSAQVDNNYVGIASDEFELRPANPNVNSSRSNYGYGYYGASNPTYGLVNPGNGTYFYPGIADIGDSARTIFYMATRYASYGNGLTIVNGAPKTYQMGDLNSLLHWNYADPVDDFERKRNQTIYSSVLNPTYYQGNRNPFIDHPEYVWAIYGTSANDSSLSVGSPSADGSSNTTVNLGHVIVGSSFATQTLQLNKAGSTPTTFDATVTGGASSTLSTPRNTFDYNAGSKTFTVGLTGTTGTVGSRSGTVTFDNTDLTSAGAGQGVSDGDDVVNVTGSVVTHGHPSFLTSSVLTNATLDFGIIARGSALLQGSVDVANQGAIGDFVAGVDVDNVALSGDDAAAFSAANQTTSNIAVGSTSALYAAAATAALGQHSATLTILTSDENIPGATNLDTLSVTLKSRIAIGGDATLDNAVNFDDLLVLAAHYSIGVGTVEATTWTTGDFNRDGVTDFSDLLALAANFTLSGSATLPAGDAAFASDWQLAQALVPEPGTALLVLAVVPALRRRRR